MTLGDESCLPRLREECAGERPEVRASRSRWSANIAGGARCSCKAVEETVGESPASKTLLFPLSTLVVPLVPALHKAVLASDTVVCKLCWLKWWPDFTTPGRNPLEADSRNDTYEV